MNTSYVKRYNSTGNITNPITKDNPYLHFFPNRSMRRKRYKSVENAERTLRKLKFKFELITNTKSSNFKEFIENTIAPLKTLLINIIRNGISLNQKLKKNLEQKRTQVFGFLKQIK